MQIKNTILDKFLRFDKNQERKPPMHIYKDEQTGQIKEEPLSQSDMAASALIIRRVKIHNNPAKLIHDFIFG